MMVVTPILVPFYLLFIKVAQVFMPTPKTTCSQHSAATKNLFIGAVLGGQDVAEVAHQFVLKGSTACNILKEYNMTGTTENQPCSGCPTKLMYVDKCHIIREARKTVRHLSLRSEINWGSKSMRSPFDMSSTMLDTIDVLLGRSPSLRSSISMHRWAGRASIVAINNTTDPRSSGLMKPTSILVTIAAISLSHIVLMRGTLKTIQFRPSSSHLCVAWCGDALYKGGMAH